MRINSIKEVEAYCDGKSLWLVSDYKGEYSIDSIIVKNRKTVKEIAEDKFCWSFNGVVGLRTSRFADVGVFTEYDEAKTYVHKLINETVVSEDPSGDIVDIYKGGYCFGLERIDKEQLDWTIDTEYEGMKCRHIALNEIYRQAVAKGIIKDGEMMTVFHTSPLNGMIYQCNNYEIGNWVITGKTNGYA